MYKHCHNCVYNTFIYQLKAKQFQNIDMMYSPYEKCSMYKVDIMTQCKELQSCFQFGSTCTLVEVETVSLTRQ